MNLLSCLILLDVTQLMESVRTCKLARELLGGHSLVKLEVIGDKNTLLPDMPETLKAAKDLS